MMFGLGTLINTISIIIAGFAGHFAGKLFKKEQQESVTKACGISVIFISIAGVMEGVLKAENGTITSGKGLLIVLCVVLGTIIGELLKIDDGLNKLAELLKQKTGNAKDNLFVDAFVTATLTVCIGAMTIVGAFQDGLTGDYTTLLVKSILDFTTVTFLTASMSKGAAFSAIPVLLIEGLLTLLSRLIAPVLSGLTVAYISLIGSILIFCVGINLVWGKKIKVANLLPALIIAVIASYIPLGF